MTSAFPSIRPCTLLCGALLGGLFAVALGAGAPGPEPAAGPRPATPAGPFVVATQGGVLGFDGAHVSRFGDAERAGEPHWTLDSARFAALPDRVVLTSPTGARLIAFRNAREETGVAGARRAPAYFVRSADGGRTWSEPRRLPNNADHALIQGLAVGGERLLILTEAVGERPDARFLLSEDGGDSWTVVSAPGAAAGLRPAAAFARSTGDLKLLLRSPDGAFAESTSRDGRTWNAPIPGPIEAVDAPAAVLPLPDGRLVLAWWRAGESAAGHSAAFELVLACSSNDGAVWSLPRPVAVRPAPLRLTLSAAGPEEFWLHAPEESWALRLSLDDLGRVPAEGRPRVVLLGDSITRGARAGVLARETFGPRLRALLRAEGIAVEVHNSGVGGERTDQALARLDRDVIALRPRVVLLMYGTNDGWVDRGKDASRLPVSAYATNLRTIVARVRAAGGVAVLMTPPLFGDGNPRNGLGEDPNVRLAPYAAACREVARELGVPLVDHHAGWAAEVAAGRPVQAWTTDGCHPNAAGQEDLARRILPVLRAALLSH